MLSKPGFSRLWEENKQIKKIIILILGREKNSCDRNLHKQMHVQHCSCVNCRECVRWEFREALLEDVSGCTKWAMGGLFSIPWDLRLH